MSLLGNYVYAQERWLETRSRHFIVYYQQGIDSEFLYQTISYSEEFYEDITERLGFRRYDFWLWEKRAKIYIYRDKDTYLKETGMPDWSGGRAIYTDKVIESFPWAKGFFTQLLAHELGHIIFREFIGPEARVPLWFEEGVATSQEIEQNRLMRKKVLINALKKQSLIPLDNLSRIDVRKIQDQYTATLFYAEAESIVSFLLDKYGQYNFVKLCRLIRDYKDFDKAFVKAYPRFQSLKDLDREWQENVKEKLM